MRSTTFALFVTVGASILLSSSTDAAPISRSSSSQTKHQQDVEALIAGRIQIKSRSRHPASSPSASASSSSSSSSSYKHKHKHNNKKYIRHASKFDKFLIPDPELSGSAWYPVQHRRNSLEARALVPEGHAVIDDEDDDAGNELLDTELESGLERPDDEDTIEGEILEEEDDDFDAVALDDGDDEGVEGHLLQHTLRVANTAANVARAEAAAVAAAARARAVESLDWLKEFEDAEGEEAGEEEVVKVVLSRFGGQAAAAEMAAHAGEV